MRRRDWSAFITWCGPVSDRHIAAIGKTSPRASDKALEPAPLNIYCQDPPNAGRSLDRPRHQRDRFACFTGAV
jgi:hypothetical protein